VTIASVARAAKLPLPDVLACSPSRSDLVAILLRDMGRETARRYRPDSAQQSARDRLFDVVISWFEVQKPRKKAVGNLFRGLAKEPLTLLSVRREILRLAEMLLALAEADSGLSSSVRAAGLAAILLRTIPVWLEDGSELDKTMAQVDRYLRRLEALL
jgi:hypothetical protein